MSSDTLITCTIAFVATAGVILRPWRLPEAIWAVAGAILLMAAGIVSLAHASHAVASAMDVCLFLTGMMLLSELARTEHLFDTLAAYAVRCAHGSATRLFLLIYATGTVVTIFMSNDATAVVLTPAVFAATKAAKAKPLPYLYICAFIANAASFVLPISNPANLVLFQDRMPSLPAWLMQFAVPSGAAIVVTLIVLYATQRHALGKCIATYSTVPRLTSTGMITALGIGVTACILMTMSWLNWPLGLPTALCGMLTAIAVLLRKHALPYELVAGISWSILPLVIGLFILVQGLNDVGVITALEALVHPLPAWSLGAGIAFLSNAMNNLPASLIAGMMATQSHAEVARTGALLIGVDLGPNLSITGSLATILWLHALRRENIQVSAWEFLKLGAVIMPPALTVALLLL